MSPKGRPKSITGHVLTAQTAHDRAVFWTVRSPTCQPVEVQAESSRLVVRRPSAEYRDAIRSYVIKVDGSRVGSVRAGRELLLNLSPGRHVVQATIDWSGSEPLEVDLAAGAVTDLVVASAGGAGEFWQMFSRRGYLTLSLDGGGTE